MEYILITYVFIRIIYGFYESKSTLKYWIGLIFAIILDLILIIFLFFLLSSYSFNPTNYAIEIYLVIFLMYIYWNLKEHFFKCSSFNFLINYYLLLYLMIYFYIDVNYNTTYDCSCGKISYVLGFILLLFLYIANYFLFKKLFKLGSIKEILIDSFVYLIFIVGFVYFMMYDGNIQVIDVIN